MKLKHFCDDNNNRRTRKSAMNVLTARPARISQVIPVLMLIGMTTPYHDGACLLSLTMAPAVTGFITTASILPTAGGIGLFTAIALDEFPLNATSTVIATSASVLTIGLGPTTLLARAERALFECINSLGSRTKSARSKPQD